MAAGRWRCAWQLALATSVIGGTSPRDARAQGRADAALSWERGPGAEECIDGDGLRRAVEERLGRAVFGRSRAPELTVSGRVDRVAGGWLAVLTLRDATSGEEGAREIRTEATRCADLDGPLAVVIALMLDLPTRRVSMRIPPSPPRATPPPAPRQPTAGGSVPARREVQLRGAAIFGAGLLPNASAGVRLGTLIEIEPVWPMTLDASWWAPQEAEQSPAEARVTLLHAGLGTCPLHLRRQELAAWACGGVQLGRLGVRGLSFDDNAEAAGFWAGAGVDLRASVRVIGPLLAGIGIGALAPLVRPTLVFTSATGEEGTLFRPLPVTGVVEVGVGVSIR